MTKEKRTPKETIRNKHYSVPEGYFENLSEQILSSLPQETISTSTQENLRGRTIRMQPWKYIAAAVIAGVGMFLTIHLSVSDKDTKGELLVSTSQSSTPLYETMNDDDADFLDYLENQYATALLADQLIEVAKDFDE